MKLTNYIQGSPNSYAFWVYLYFTYKLNGLLIFEQLQRSILQLLFSGCLRKIILAAVVNKCGHSCKCTVVRVLCTAYPSCLLVLIDLLSRKIVSMEKREEKKTWHWSRKSSWVTTVKSQYPIYSFLLQIMNTAVWLLVWLLIWNVDLRIDRFDCNKRVRSIQQTASNLSAKSGHVYSSFEIPDTLKKNEEQNGHF